MKPLRGTGCAAAIAAVGFGLASLMGVSTVRNVETIGTSTVTVAGVAILLGLLTAAGFALVLVRPTTAFAVAAASATAAVAIVVAVLIYAHALGGRHAALRLLDVHSSTLLALSAGVAAAVGCACLGTPGGRADRHQAPTRSSLRSGIATLLVCLIAVGGLVAAAQPSLRIQSETAAFVATPAVPTTITTTAFRLRLADDDVAVIPAGPGFAVATADGVTAYDGLTGEPRWRFDAATVGGWDEEPVLDNPSDGVVEVAGADLTVGLDAVTGVVVRRSAPKAAPAVPASACQSGDSEADPRYRVQHVCGSATDFEIVEQGDMRSLTIAVPRGAIFSDLASLGDGFFAAEHRLTRHGDHLVTVIDAARGVVADQFEVTSASLSPIRNGIIGVAERDDRVRLRNVRTRTWSDLPTLNELSSNDVSRSVWLGDRLALPYRDGFVMVDPTRLSVTRQDVCTPGSGSSGSWVSFALVAPGSVVAVCDPSNDAPYKTEIVGLR